MAAQLKRTLSLGGSVAMLVGLVIGPSIFVLIPELAGMAGPSLFIAYIVSVIPVVFTGLYLMQLGGALPVTAANYYSITRLISPTAGFLGSLAGFAAMISTNCIVCWGFAEYFSKIVPGISPMVVAVVVVLVFGIVNWVGVQIFEWVQILMVLLLVLTMLLFGIGGAVNANPEYLQPLFPKGIGSFILVMAVSAFSYIGFIAITEVAGEIKNPKRNIPRALILAIIIVTVLYVLQTFAFVSTLKWDEAAKAGPTAVLVAARTFLPEWGVSIIAIAALLAMATTINAIMLMAAREGLAWSRDQLVPSVFSRISKRFNTPEIAILLTTVLSVAGVIAAAQLSKYALMVVFALMFIQGLGAVAVWRLPKLMPEVYKKSLIQFSPFWRNFTMIGCLVCFTLLFLFGWMADYKTGIVFTAFIVIGLAYWYWRKAYMKKRGVHLDTMLAKMSQDAMMELKDS